VLLTWTWDYLGVIRMEIRLQSAEEMKLGESIREMPGINLDQEGEISK